MEYHQQQRINQAAQQFTDALVGAYKVGSNRTVAVQDLGAQLTGHFFNSVINNLRTQAEGTRQVTQHLADQQRRAQEATREFTQAATNTYMDLLDSIFSFYQGGTTRTKMRIEEAERRAEEAESLTDEAKRRAEQAEERTEEAERSTREAEGRAKKAEERTEEAESRAEQAERSTEEAQRRTEQAERSTEEAQRRGEEAERRLEEAESSSSEAESQRDDDLPLADYDSLNIRQISERLDELSIEEIRRLRDYEARNKNRSTLVNRLDSRIESSSSQ
jgi:DNA repair exonuclease SbcCD ATPase subunit